MPAPLISPASPCVKAPPVIWSERPLLMSMVPVLAKAAPAPVWLTVRLPVVRVMLPLLACAADGLLGAG